MSSFEDRARRAWLAGCWAGAVVAGRCNSPNCTPRLALASRKYVVLRTPRSIDVRIATSRSEYWGRLTPSVRVALSGLYVLPELNIWCSLGYFTFGAPSGAIASVSGPWLLFPLLGLAFPGSEGHSCSCKHTGRLKLGLGGWGRHQALGSTSTYTQHISERNDIPMQWSASVAFCSRPEWGR